MDVITFVLLTFLHLQCQQVQAEEMCALQPPEVTDKFYRLCPYTEQCPKYKGVMSAITARGCFCDKHCRLYEDCCSDYSLYTDVEPLPPSTYSCQYLSGVWTNNLPVYVINKCHPAWPYDGIREECEKNTTDVFYNWPLSDNSSIIYKNIYCAHCNYKERDDLVFWFSNFTCNVEDNSTDSIDDVIEKYLEQSSSDVCNVTYLHPKGDKQYRNCKPNIDRCPVEWNDSCTRDKCEGINATEAYRYDSERTKMLIYKNKFCALCNDAQGLTCQDYVTKQYFDSKTYSQAFGRLYPLSIVIDMNVGYGSISRQVGASERKKREKIVVCGEGQVYDPFSRRCRVVLCPPHLQYVHEYCELNWTECSHYALLNQSEYTLFENGSILIEEHGTIFGNDSYVSYEQNLYFCLQNASQNGSVDYWVHVQKFTIGHVVVSYIGQSLSCLALLVLLIIYSIFPSLRNLPGKTLMCLAASLLVFMLLTMLGFSMTEPKQLCITMGVIVHFSLLAAYFWMNVMSYDIWSTFSGDTAHASSEELTVRFRWYSAYAWGTSAFLVLISLSVNFGTGQESILSPQYGKTICYINNRYALILFVGFPYFVLILSNIIFYILTLRSIENIGETTKLVQDKDQQTQRLYLYMKLSSIMGVTWLVGIVAILADHEAVYYIFIILNSFQGLFVALAFLCTKKVFRLVRDMYNRKRYGVRMKDTRSSTIPTKRTSVSSETHHRTSVTTPPNMKALGRSSVTVPPNLSTLNRTSVTTPPDQGKLSHPEKIPE